MSLFRRHSPLNADHAVATALARTSSVPPEYVQRRLLYGRAHRVMYPLSALTTQSELGSVRHALAQRVVGGGYYVDTPFAGFKAIQPPPPSKDKAPRGS